MRALDAGTSARISRLETDRASHAHAQARGGYLPQVGLTSEAGWSNRTDDTFFGLDKSGTKLQEYSLATIAPERAWLQLYLSQTLFDLKAWRDIERKEIEADVARIAEGRGRDEVAYEVTRRYLKLLELQRKSAQAEERLVEAQWLAQQADQLFEAGRALEVEHSLVELHLEEAEIETRAKQKELDAARADLWLALGESEPHSMPITLDPESLPSVDASHASVGLAEQVANSPEIRILDLQRRIEDAQVSAAKAGRWPTLKFVTGYANYGPKRYDAYEDEVWVGVDLQVPIFDGFQSGHKIEGARRTAEIARLRHHSELEKKRVNVREMAQQLETGEERLALAERRAETAREQLRLADIGLRNERGDLRASLSARERLARASEEAIDSRIGQVLLWADLQRELGQLSDQLLGPKLAKAP